MDAPAAVIWLQGEGGASPLLQLMPFVLIFLIFYFLLIRPQQRQQKEREAMLRSLERGDEVVTAGGVHGVITGIADDVLTVEIAALKGERVRVKVDRARIERRKKKAEGEQ
jgi:preprotein translocase subunit YajC